MRKITGDIAHGLTGGGVMDDMETGKTQLSIILRTSVFRGDHWAELIIPYSPRENESVQDLARRLIDVQANDWIEIRRIREENAE